MAGATLAAPHWTLGHALHPSTLLLVAGNALPLAGVWLWGWDAFLILILYWMETAVIGFWTLVRVAVKPDDTLGDRRGWMSRLSLLVFLTFHAGLFMTVHFAILWGEFAGDWRAMIDTPWDFALVVVWQTGLWIALMAMVVSHGVACLRSLIDMVALRRLILRAWPDYPGRLPLALTVETGSAVAGFYGRIILMQVAVLAGGFAAVSIGMATSRVIAPLVLLIALKTLIDLSIHMASLAHGESRAGARLSQR